MTDDSSQPLKPGSSLEPGSTRETRSSRGRIALTILVVIIGICLYVFAGDEFRLDRLAARESELRAQVEQHPLAAMFTALLIYVVATAFAIPVATVLSLLYAWLFGFWRALLVVSFGSTAGATLCFLFTRYVLTEFVQRRFARQLAAFQDSLDRDGSFFLLSLRLVPYVPFFIINIVMGLTRMKTWTFWWVSQIGMLPGTVVYLFAGSSIVSLETLRQSGIRGIVSTQLLIALALLGAFPLLAKFVVRSRRRNESSK